MNNYEFCVQWLLDQEHGKRAAVLDYGCGAGGIVTELRKRDVDAFGCDLFYEGGDYSRSIDPSLVDAGIIKKMVDGTIPFANASFDYVINNQVMEHTTDLDGVLAQIQRVLKAGGVVLSLFPDESVWRGGHCGVPFLHWFQKGSHVRVYYAAAFRALGFGHYKGAKSIMGWSREFCQWLDKWTHY